MRVPSGVPLRGNNTEWVRTAFMCGRALLRVARRRLSLSHPCRESFVPLPCLISDNPSRPINCPAGTLGAAHTCGGMCKTVVTRRRNLTWRKMVTKERMIPEHVLQKLEIISNLIVVFRLNKIKRRGKNIPFKYFLYN